VTKIANVEMAEAWDGEEGASWAENADRYDATGVAIWQRFLDADLIRAEDRVLDIGCGTGHSSRDVARLASSGSVLGIDLSSRMLALARERSAADGLTNAEFLQADAQVHPFEPEAFDIAISSFGVMFFADRDAAFGNIGRALGPGGRLALLVWRGFGQNEWLLALREALAAGRELPSPASGDPGPFGLADADGATECLAGAGFEDVVFTPIDEPVCLGADADDAYEFVSRLGLFRGMTDGLDEATRAEAVAKLRAMLTDHETADGVLLASAAWLITASKESDAA
jgi:SAM-dependent methyltransferase